MLNWLIGNAFKKSLTDECDILEREIYDMFNFSTYGCEQGGVLTIETLQKAIEELSKPCHVPFETMMRIDRINNPHIYDISS